MNDLDSRSMRYTDCYMQKFSTLGTIYYQLTTAAGTCLPVDTDSAFTIEITERYSGSSREGRQHNVTISRKGNQLIAEPAHLKIEAGDAVLWHTPDATITNWMVRGEGDAGSFSSSAMTVDALYTHAFGTPGEYEWVDANHGQVSGTVIVRSLDSRDPEQCRDWFASLEQGTVVLVDGDRAEPSKLEILAGQTVFWAVQKADGISITDARLVPQRNDN